MAHLSIDITQIDELQNAMEKFQGNVEAVINDVLHTEAVPLIQGEILQLMPVSGRKWNGKKGAAKTSKSLADEQENLAVTVKTTKNYQYLYFPDDGTNTYRHAGNQQFFQKGGANQKEEIINRCINGLVKGLEDAIN